MRGADALDFKRIVGEHSIQQDLAAVNPSGNRQNCGNCAVAYAMRRQGFDVEARAGEEGLPFVELADMFDGVSIQYPTILTTSDEIYDVIQKIEQDILSWGEGANGAIRGQWADVPEFEAGHLFSVEVSYGKVMFVDGQFNDDDVKNYLEAMAPLSIVYGRLDNSRPNDNVKRAVTGRGIKK
jgi:hypothetical protein